MFQTGVFCWAGETSSHWVAVWKKCVECVASLPQILPASWVCAWLPWSPRDPLSSCQVQWAHKMKIINTLSICFNVYFSTESHYFAKKGSPDVCVSGCECVCVAWWMAAAYHNVCHLLVQSRLMAGKIMYLFAHKALPLRCPLISMRCDGEPDQWVYFGKRVGDCQCIIPGLCWAMPGWGHLLPKNLFNLKKISKAVLASDVQTY